jgi:hypothetical protein
MAVGGEDGAVAYLKRGTVEVRYCAACFFDYQPAGGVNRRIQFEFLESLEATHRCAA